MRRTARLFGGHIDGWSDFWTFVADIGDLPSPIHRLYRIDETKPFGPDNVAWRERIDAEPQGGGRLAKNAYMRRYSIERPHVRKAHYLKRHYGISLAQYEAMRAVHGGVCGICRQPESALDNKGKARMLAIDHDHETGQIRGLLCSAHNTALGLFNDDPGLLRAAIAYLGSHASP